MSKVRKVFAEMVWEFLGFDKSLMPSYEVVVRKYNDVMDTLRADDLCIWNRYWTGEDQETIAIIKNVSEPEVDHSIMATTQRIKEILTTSEYKTGG